MMENNKSGLALGRPVDDYRVTMTSMTRRVARNGIVREVIDRAQHVLLIGRILIGVEMTRQSLYL
jgi:hypothetical protein